MRLGGKGGREASESPKRRKARCGEGTEMPVTGRAANEARERQTLSPPPQR